MTMLLLKGQSRYAATRAFIDELAAACARVGVDALVADVEGVADPVGALAEVVDGYPLSCIFSIGLFGETRDAQGRTLAEALGAPHVVQYVDYPLSHYFRLAGTPAQTALLTVDPSHVEAVRSVYGAARFPHVSFSPHGVIGEATSPGSDVETFLRTRDIPLLFPATFYRPATPMWSGLDAATQRVFDTALEICLGSEFVPALVAFDEALDLHGGHLTGDARAQMRVNAFAVHEQARAHRRFAFLKAAARVGLPIQMVGGGYDAELALFDNVTHLGETNLPQTVELMRRSRAVLSLNANFGQGSHERPLSALMAGAAAVTDFSSFYEEALGPDGVVQLRWARLDEDLEALVRLIEAPERLFEVAVAGGRKAAAHRWDARIPAILAAADAVRKLN